MIKGNRSTDYHHTTLTFRLEQLILSIMILDPVSYVALPGPANGHS